MIKGSELQLLLKKRGILQKDICKKLNINQSQVSRYFTDDINMPATFVIDVAVMANLTIDELIKSQPNKVLEPHVPYIKRVNSLNTNKGTSIMIDNSPLDEVILYLKSEIERINSELIKLKNNNSKLNHAS